MSKPHRLPRYLPSMAVLVCLCAIFTTAALADDAPGKAGEPPPPSPEDIKLHAPGPQHALLGKLAGDWEGDYEYVITPGAQVKHGKGSEHIESINGGRFIQGHYHGQTSGKPFDGQNLIGFDNARKKYVGLWVNDNDTELVTVDGTADATGKVLTFSRDIIDPDGTFVCHVDLVITFVDENTHLFDVNITVKGIPPFRATRITYTRVK